MQYDTIVLEAVMVDLHGYSASAVDYCLKINGVEFHPEHSLDITSLVKSCQQTGELDIFTCGCSAPGCAGIFQGIEVGHSHNEITWKCPHPLSVSEHTLDLRENSGTTFVHFAFESEQYIDAIDAGIKQIKSLAISAPIPCEFQVHDLELEQVLALETRPFSAHTMEPNWRILARQVVIDAYHGLVTVGGVGYQMEDLNFEAELMQAYLAWRLICVFPNNESEIPAYLAYLQKGRSFCRALRKNIGRQTAVKFKYHPPPIYNKDAWEIIEIIR